MQQEPFPDTPANPIARMMSQLPTTEEQQEAVREQALIHDAEHKGTFAHCESCTWEVRDILYGD